MGYYTASAVRLKFLEETPQEILDHFVMLATLTGRERDPKHLKGLPTPKALELPEHNSYGVNELVANACAYINWHSHHVDLLNRTFVLCGSHRWFDLDGHLKIIAVLRDYLDIQSFDVVAHLVYESAARGEMLLADDSWTVCKSLIGRMYLRDVDGEADESDPLHPVFHNEIEGSVVKPENVCPDLPWTLEDVMVANQKTSWEQWTRDTGKTP
jgi:hypothetical protein